MGGPAKMEPEKSFTIESLPRNVLQYTLYNPLFSAKTPLDQGSFSLSPFRSPFIQLYIVILRYSSLVKISTCDVAVACGFARLR